MLDQVLVLFGLPHYLDARTGIQRPGGKVDDFYDIRLEYKVLHKRKNLVAPGGVLKQKRGGVKQYDLL